MRQMVMYDDAALQAAELRRLQKHKTRTPAESARLGAEVVRLFDKQIRPRQGRFGRLGEAWAALVPAALAEHACVEGFHRGTLTVLVDSASHRYELQQLLLAGLERQLKDAVPSATLRKVSLKPGRWYDGQGEARF